VCYNKLSIFIYSPFMNFVTSLITFLWGNILNKNKYALTILRIYIIFYVMNLKINIYIYIYIIKGRFVIIK